VISRLATWLSKKQGPHDELALYPGSLVFEYGNFQIGVKIRWPRDSCASIASQLRRRIKGAGTIGTRVSVH